MTQTACKRTTVRTWLMRVVRRDEGVTFIEVVVTLIMVMAASVLTMHSLFFSHRTLDSDMHKNQVLSFVQREMEYWVGRMYMSTDGNPSSEEMQRRDRYKQYEIIDDSKDRERIYVYISKSEIMPVVDPEYVNEQGNPMTGYWKITLWGEWTEPDGQDFSRRNGNAVELSTYIARRF